MSAEPTLRTHGVGKDFPIRSGVLTSRVTGRVRAVDDVSLEIATGTTLGLVGESGCGKSTLGRLIVRLLDVTAGEVVYDGRTLSRVGRSELRSLRPQVQMVFQDTQSSLDPRLTVESAVGEPLRLSGRLRGVALYRAVAELVERVGLDRHHLQSRPHELSGGQRQRVVIARALATNPKLVVLDEPTSALDVSVQAQIVNLLTDLQAELGLTYLFIAHDLGVVKHISSRVAVMYLGKVVELAPKRALYASPRHPYTQALLKSVPITHPSQRRRGAFRKPPLSGDIPTAIAPPAGCRFHTRCPHVMPICSQQEPAMRPAGEAGHAAACHLIPPPP